MKDVELEVLQGLLNLNLADYESGLLERGVAFAQKISRGTSILVKLTDAKLIPAQLNKHILGNPRLGKYLRYEIIGSTEVYCSRYDFHKSIVIYELSWR